MHRGGKKTPHERSFTTRQAKRGSTMSSHCLFCFLNLRQCAKVNVRLRHLATTSATGVVCLAAPQTPISKGKVNNFSWELKQPFWWGAPQSHLDSNLATRCSLSSSSASSQNVCQGAFDSFSWELTQLFWWGAPSRLLQSHLNSNLATRCSTSSSSASSQSVFSWRAPMSEGPRNRAFDSCFR
jgi:hypothetical protein